MGDRAARGGAPASRAPAAARQHRGTARVQRWPAPPPPDPHAWQAAIESLEEAEARLRELLIRTDARRFTPGAEGFDGALLEEVVAALMHVAWHAGQVTLLRRAQGLQSWNYNRAVNPDA